MVSRWPALFVAMVWCWCAIGLEAGDKVRPQEPKKPYPYTEEEVVVRIEKGDVKLAGTLTLPKGNGPFPAVFLVGPPAAYDRNLTHDGHKPFLVLADHLSRQGLAVLRVDQRGVGKSTGSQSEATAADFVDDAKAVLSFLRDRKEIDAKKLGLIGHGEGAMVAQLAAGNNRDVAWLVLLAHPEEVGSGPARKIEFLPAKVEALLKASPAPELTASWLFRVQYRIMDAAKTKPHTKSFQKEIRQIFAAELPGLEKDDLAFATKLEKALGAANWLQYRLSVRPDGAGPKAIPQVGEVVCPKVAFYGELDHEVPAKIRPKAGSHVHVLKGLNHWFQTCKTGNMNEYGAIAETMAPALLDSVGNWIAERIK